MLKRSILAASAATLLSAQAAHADVGFVYLTLSVPQQCVIASTGFLGPNGSQSTIDYTPYIVDGYLAPVSGNVTAAEVDAFCNTPRTRLTLESASGGLERQGSPITAFGNFAPTTLPYTVEPSWGGAPLNFPSFRSEQNSRTVIDVNAPVSGFITLKVALDEQLNPLLAGYYEDQLTVTIDSGV